MVNLKYLVVFLLHLILTMFLFFGWIFNKKIILEILFILLILSISLFIIFKGCILSKLEKKIFGVNKTILDPFIFISNKYKKIFTFLLFMNSFFITSYKLFYNDLISRN